MFAHRAIEVCATRGLTTCSFRLSLQTKLGIRIYDVYIYICIRQCIEYMVGDDTLPVGLCAACMVGGGMFGAFLRGH